MAKNRLDPKDELEIILSSFSTLHWVKEHRFHPERRWRIDYANLSNLVAVEYEGGAWTRGRHTRPQGFINDCDKYNELALYGWTLLRYTSEHLKEPDKIIYQIRRAIAKA